MIEIAIVTFFIDPEHRDYARKIRNFPLLSPEEEYQLAKKWSETQDKQSVNLLISSHLRLVSKVAKGYRGYGLALSDLISEGNIGVMQAVKNYDPDKGFRFASYAIWWIKANIHDYILKNWSVVKIGSSGGQKKLFFGLRKMQRNLQTNPGDQEFNEEKAKIIAAKIGVKPEEVLQMNQRLSGKDSSLNNSVKFEENDREWIEWIADDRDNQEIMLAQQQEAKRRKQLLSKALACLNKREQEILRERRLTEPPKTLEQVSLAIGVSRERVRQIEKQSFLKLQKAIKHLSPNISWQHI